MWGMSYIPLGEAEPVKPPCELLGHFYENYECIYCPAKYCATERGGHSFEDNGRVNYRSATVYCHYCQQYKVNISKGLR